MLPSTKCTIALVTGGRAGDEGARAKNDAVCGRAFVATAGLRVPKLPPSMNSRRGHSVQSGDGRDRTDPIVPDLRIRGSF